MGSSISSGDFKNPKYFYKILQEKEKNSYKEIHQSNFNKNYCFHVNKFVPTKKKIYKNSDCKDWDIINWKTPLLDKLFVKDNKNNISWKKKLYDFIIEDENKNFENYILYNLQNIFFIEQYYLLNLPPVNDKNFQNIHKPILTILSNEELKSYSNTKIKNKKNNEIKKEKPNKSKEIELTEINSKSYTDKIEDDDKHTPNETINLTFNGELPKSPPNNKDIYIDKDIDNDIINKYNCYLIQRIIDLLRVQIEDKKYVKDNLIDINIRKGEKKHPICIIIKKFSEYFTQELNTWFQENIFDKIPELESFLNKDKNNLINDFSDSEDDIINFLILNESMDKISELKGFIDRQKEKVIKDIQTFIEALSVSLKLFYSKSINYKIFISEKDEFINLICYFLFKENDFYNSVFNLFELSNIKQYKDLKEKKENFKKLTLEEIGVDPKFCLDEKNIDNSTFGRIKSQFVEFIELQDLVKRRYSVFSKNNLQEAGSFSLKDKINYTPTNSVAFDNKKEKKQKEKNLAKEEKLERKNTISSYQEFAELYNSLNTTLKAKYAEDMNNYPSKMDFPKLEDCKNKLKIPYGEAINYIEKIKDYNIPLDKLTIIALVSVLITDCVDEFWKGKKKNLIPNNLNIDADNLMTIYLYIIYNLDLPSIFTQLDFIQNFTGSVSKQSMIGYYFTTVGGSLEFIMGANEKKDLLPKKK